MIRSPEVPIFDEPGDWYKLNKAGTEYEPASDVNLSRATLRLDQAIEKPSEKPTADPAKATELRDDTEYGIFLGVVPTPAATQTQA